MERRNPANLFVRDCITKALFKLMRKKPFGGITVSKLVEVAGVSRNSFYRNYQSLEDILRQYMMDQTTAWWSGFIANPDRYPHVIAEMFEHFEDMQEAISLIYKADRSYLLMEHIALCGKQSLTGVLDNAYKTAFMSGGLWGLTNEWVLRGMVESPSKMEALFFAQGQNENDI